MAEGRDLRPTGQSRANRLGLTTCEVVGVDGLELAVRGLDAIDGSTVLDIEPHITEFEPRGAVVRPDWISGVDGRLPVTDRQPQERIVAGTC